MYEKERRALIDCALQMKECRLITLCGGNVCMRLNNGNIAVTPSGMDYEIMTSDDVVIVTPQGKIVEGTAAPPPTWMPSCIFLKNSLGQCHHSYPPALRHGVGPGAGRVPRHAGVPDRCPAG